MRVLFVQTYANALSESYMRTEAEWAIGAGVEVFVWAERPHISTYNMEIPSLIAGRLEEAVQQFRPDLIHVHWMTLAGSLLPELERIGIPVTVRAHSFDFSVHGLWNLERSAVVKRIFVFPHLAAQVSGFEKVEPLPACYDPRFYYPRPSPMAGERSVFRAAAGLEKKGLEEFVEIAHRCPDFRFLLALTRAAGIPEHVDKFTGRLAENLSVVVNLSHEQVANEMRHSGLYLRGYDPTGHQYGMPVSIAEALGSGCVVLTHKNTSPFARHCLLYETVDEAARLINGTKEWSPEELQARRRRSLQSSWQFRADAVLSRMLEAWEVVTAGGGL